MPAKGATKAPDAKEPMKATEAKEAKEPKDTKKEAGMHLTLINVHLGSALLGAKALDSLAGLNVPPTDAHVKETERNLSTAISGAETHLGHLKDMANMPMPRIEELAQHLKEAKGALRQLQTGKAENFDQKVDNLAGHLASADEIFRDVAKQANFTLIDDIKLNKVPVSGKEEPDLDQPKDMKEPKDKTNEGKEGIDRNDASDQMKDQRPLPPPAEPTSPPSGY